MVLLATSERSTSSCRAARRSMTDFVPTVAQTPGRILNVDPPILDSNTPMV